MYFEGKRKEAQYFIFSLAFKFKHKKVKYLLDPDVLNQELIDFVFQVTRETVLREK